MGPLNQEITLPLPFLVSRGSREITLPLPFLVSRGSSVKLML